MPTTTVVSSSDASTPSVVDELETVTESVITTNDTCNIIPSSILDDIDDDADDGKEEESTVDDEYDDNDEFGEFGYAPLADSEVDEQETEVSSTFDNTTHLKGFTVPKPVEPIPEDDVKFIKEVMSRFEFPEHAIPAWAKYIPEQAWLPKVKEVSLPNE
ncbi:hypothetical protein BDF22DRAFT_654560 [Syncephalis plumigaleata]|nr:hypothetical protein BDF22DRAFT_654560 [Syncephalis plumigaleata]